MQQSGDNKLLKKNQSGECVPLQQAMITHYIIHVDRMLHNLKTGQPNTDELKSRISDVHINTRKSIWPARILTISVFIAILLGVGTLIFTPDNNQPTSYANDVNPGLDKAILPRFNETKIKLSDTGSSSLVNRLSMEIGKADDSILVYKATSNWNTLGNNGTTTAKRGQYKNVLPDGPRIRLYVVSISSYNTSLKSHRS